MLLSAGNHQRLTVGFVGYPNVGKSSVINSLIAAGREEGDRRISVAHGPSPGKTKHLQTIFVRKNICLCDCPGIVFPSVINSKADLVCNGVLSIHTLRDVVEPLQLVCESVPRKVMERHCGLAIPTKLNTPVRARNAQDMVRAIRLERLGQQMICDTPANNQNEVYTADDLLRILCMRRKFYQQNSGNLDLRTGGIMILRDYIQGQLQHWKLPPGL
ncbi:hypothetical protein GUITHDRAFT_86182 [Guillardia theta CCMP2712]|uniref:G domain-containing protein n=1 Tax=Guillardia theta (strain CCMP2712) TaxID=905079 RepID=L1JJ46_GUITC|nr:hypothetical protein GUITHDRAFT_86182 [Guillardia theta CCMP2712]EKX48179.1 hypothetical protein GUITHDRAFT_86182 [Guillardia theta CCMP2712]|eukprot:XP_005835159.1 hypothetical protein GUITHDRAFT_86182 [Guillardia theta CCMP2712]